MKWARYLLCAVCLTTLSAFWHGISGPPAADTVCTITTGNCTGVGGGSALFTAATCNGIANDVAAFNSFNAWAVSTWQVAHPGLLIELDVPSGKICEFASGTVNSNNIAKGLKRFQLVGYGAEFGDANGTGGGFALGGGAQAGVQFNGTDSTARLATVTAGSSCVDLLDVTKLPLWNASDWALITGIDPQGFGDPSNPMIFQWLQVSSTDAVHKCDGTTSGASVRFVSALTDTYKSTWPSYNVGVPGLQSDNGGPATLYQVTPQWDTVQRWYGLKINQVSGQTNANGRDITLQDMSCPIAFCVIPSQNLNWRAINFNSPASSLEFDKIITNVSMQNVVYRRLLIQSGISNFTCTNCTIGPIGITGTARTTTLVNSNISDLTLGAIAYGASGAFTGTNTVISSLGTSGANQSNIDTRGVWAGGTLTVPANMRISSAANNGSGAIRLTVISTAGWTTGISGDGPNGTPCAGTFPVTVISATQADLQGSTFTATCTGTFGSLPLNWAVPGANIYLTSGSHGSPTSAVFQVADLAVGANNSTVVSFNQNGSPYAGGLPTMPAGAAVVTVHPAPSFSCTGCSGAINVTDVTGIPAGPFGSFATRVVTAANSGSATAIPVFGPLSEVDMTVTAACSGASNVGFQQAAFTGILNSSSFGSLNPTANALIASATPRKVFPTTSSGAQTGDVLTTPGAGTILLTGQTIPFYSTVANCGAASTTVTIQTNQGVVYP